MPGRDSSQVLGGPDLDIYDAPYDTDNALPADSAYGTAWGSPFVNRGYTRDGMHVRWRRQWTEWMVDQEVTPVLRTPDTFDLRFGAQLAQFDNANLAAATQQGTVSTVAAGVARGHVDYAVSAAMQLAYVSLGFDMKNPGDGESVRLLAYRGIPMGDIDLGLMRRPPGTQINYEIFVVPDTSTDPDRLFISRDIIPISA